MSIDIESIDFSGCVQKSELARNDTIDITYRLDKENNNVIFEAEDIISDGYVVFKVIGNANNVFITTKLYIRIINGNIEEY